MIFEKQQYQEDCVNNIIKVLEPLGEDLSDASALKSSLAQVQKEKDIPITTRKNETRLDVLMETGTGKTFTYIKTMYEMNKHYGINKFVIFVPRLAIRAGIVQNIDLTSSYFFQEYGKRLGKYTYEQGLSGVYNYLRNKDELSVLILTSASIAPNGNNGNESSRILSSKTSESALFPMLSPLEAINTLSPVVFLDEPHLLKGPKFIQAYKDHFAKSLLIRFGATFPEEEHSELSNVIYTLDSITAFRSNLVKKIRVRTFHDTRFGFRISRIINKNQAEIVFPRENMEETRSIELIDDIGEITGNKEHSGVHIVKLTPNKTRGGTAYLSNGTSMMVARYSLDDKTTKEMIRDTIDKHFQKERVLFQQGIKTLSLFFIPNINDFRGDTPTIKNIFEEEYKKARKKVLKGAISQQYRNYLDMDFDDEGALRVHQGYFSGDNDSDEKIGKEISLILNNKTELLKTDKPLRFIFSVWALQEGWDNPNILNICKLSPTSKDISRRQQVGRGLRLAVDTNGVRQTIKKCDDNDSKFYGINMLDMIVSSQEGDFIKDIQDEIISSSFTFGGNLLTEDMLQPTLNRQEIRQLINFLEDNKVIEFAEEENVYIIQEPPIEDFIRENRAALHPVLAESYDKIMRVFENTFSPVEDGNKGSEEISIRQDNLKEFRELWETIIRKAEIVYQDIEEGELINAISKAFNETSISRRKILKTEYTYHHEDDTIEKSKEEFGGEENFFDKKGSYENFVFEFAKKAQKPIPFIVRLFNKVNKENISNDPNMAEKLLLEIINEKLHGSVIESVGYEFNGQVAINPKNVFYDENGNPIKKIRASKLGRYTTDEAPADSYLYDKICFDSGIEKRVSLKSEAPKEEFSIGEITGEIMVFAKLPRISIPTPYRHYNPDFAYYIKTNKGKKIFFIAETKGYDNEDAIPAGERNNIAYAKKFFRQLDREVGDNIQVIFRQRINKQTLVELLQDVGSQ